MEQRERKKWDPVCPKCQEELQRLLELAQGVDDEVDHGVALYGLPLPEYCNHEIGKEA
jgi:hypothetical protein